MSMDLKLVCPHCDAPKGVMCKVDCPVNGRFIKDLNEILKRLNLKHENLKLIQLKKERINSNVSVRN